MDKFVEYDPYTGVKTTTYIPDDDDDIHVTKEQDVSSILDMNAEARNTKSADNGIQKGLWKYCSIPMVVAYEMLKKGINVYNPDHLPRVLAEVNTHYPHLKNTDKTHAIGSRKPKPSQSAESSTRRGPFVIVR
jgi:hypothetical protein